LLAELAETVSSRYMFGALAVGQGVVPTIALEGSVPDLAPEGDDNAARSPSGAAAALAAAHDAGVWTGGLTGMAFGPGVSLVSRVTQGCCPAGARHTVTEASNQVVYALDGEPALDVLMDELGVGSESPRQAVERLRATLVGLSHPPAPADAVQRPRVHGELGDDEVVRHLIGVDPLRHGVAVAETVKQGQTLVFCERNPETARADLVRICTEIRETLEAPGDPLAGLVGGSAQAGLHGLVGFAEETVSARPPRRVLGAIYISCAGRTGAHFGAPGAEMALIRHALGDVPLVGLFAGGEIAHHRLYGYTGVLTVFVEP
jgi:small ligand-binding sensory domain FIST